MWARTCASTAKYNSRFAASCGSSAQYSLLSQILLHMRKAMNLSLSRRVFDGYLITRVRHSNTPKTRSVARKFPSEYFCWYAVIFRPYSQFALNSSVGGRDKWNGPQVFGPFVWSYGPPGKGIADWVQCHTFRWDPPRSGLDLMLLRIRGIVMVLLFRAKHGRWVRIDRDSWYSHPPWPLIRHCICDTPAIPGRISQRPNIIFPSRIRDVP